MPYPFWILDVSIHFVPGKAILPTRVTIQPVPLLICHRLYATFPLILRSSRSHITTLKASCICSIIQVHSTHSTVKSCVYMYVTCSPYQSWNVNSYFSYCTGRISARLLNPASKIYEWQFVYWKVTNGPMQDSRSMRPRECVAYAMLDQEISPGSCWWMPPLPMFLLPHMNHTTCILSRQLCHQS